MMTEYEKFILANNLDSEERYFNYEEKGLEEILEIIRHNPNCKPKIIILTSTPIR